MSRSIHATRRAIAELRKQFADGTARPGAYGKAPRELRRKRLLKQQVAGERNRKSPPLAGTAVSTIPIDMLDEGPHVHHSASTEDIRAVLEALPAAATEGIGRIQLGSGKQYIDEHLWGSDNERDPWIGRLSVEVFPGVYGAEIAGYWNQAGLIAIHAYVYDGAGLPLPRSPCEVYLRLQALKTLAHEVAHHHDHTQRVRRGRWLADRHVGVERYAEKMEQEWTLEVVVPWLLRAYPREVDTLLEWVGHQGGVALPLEFFVGNSRSAAENVSYSTEHAFEDWVAGISQCASLTESRLAFAWELYCAGAFEECLAVTGRILAGEPDHLGALGCRARTCARLDQCGEALALVERIVAKEPRNADAWQARGEVFACRREWKNLLDYCARWEAALGSTVPSAIHYHRALAYCASGDEPAMEQCLQAFQAASGSEDAELSLEVAQHVRARVRARAGQDKTTSTFSDILIRSIR